MKETRYHMELSDYERRALIGVLAEKRNDFLKANDPTEDINNLLEKAIDAPSTKAKKKDRDER